MLNVKVPKLYYWSKIKEESVGYISPGEAVIIASPNS